MNNMFFKCIFNESFPQQFQRLLYFGGTFSSRCISCLYGPAESLFCLTLVAALVICYTKEVL